jgi:type I restriction enzyme S subunit
MKKVENTPVLRFHEFSGEWETKKIGEIGEIVTGSTPPTANYEFYNGDYLFVSPFDINETRWLKQTKTTLTQLGFSKGRKIRSGSSLFVCIGSTIGKVAQNKIECISNQQINSVIPVNNDDNFVYSLLENHSSRIKMMSAEQAVPIINKTTFLGYKLSIPTLQEQQKIATFLIAVDEKLQALKQKKSLLEQYKKGVMQKIFSQELRFKDDNGNDFSDWEKQKLGNLTYKVDKKNKKNIKYPVYSINNKEGFLPQSEQFEGMDSNERGYDISLYKIIEPNTFAYNPARINVGSIGYSGDLSKVIISSLYVCFKTKESLEDKYLLQYLNTKDFNKSIIAFQEGGVRLYLFYDSFSKIPIPLPSNEEQNKIAVFLSSIDEKINHTENQIKQSEQWKKGLLQKMFV